MSRGVVGFRVCGWPRRLLGTGFPTFDDRYLPSSRIPVDVTRGGDRRHRRDVRVTVDEAFQKFGPELLRHAAVLVGPDHADDIVSEALIGALRSKRWPEADSQVAYLHRSVVNAARMWQRGRFRSDRREWMSTVVAASPHGEYISRPEVAAAVRNLSVRQRSVIYFTYWEDLTPARVAEVLSVSEGTVRRHLARARENLRKVLDD